MHHLKKNLLILKRTFFLSHFFLVGFQSDSRWLKLAPRLADTSRVCYTLLSADSFLRRTTALREPKPDLY